MQRHWLHESTMVGANTKLADGKVLFVHSDDEDAQVYGLKVKDIILCPAEKLEPGTTIVLWTKRDALGQRIARHVCMWNGERLV